MMYGMTPPTDSEKGMKQMIDLVRLSLDGIVVVDVTGVVVFANPAAEALMGMATGEAPGYHLGYPAAGSEPTEITLRQGTSDPAIVEMRAQDTLWEGKPAFVVNLRDVTEKKKTFDQAQHLAAIIHSTDDAVISKTLNGIITSWNTGAARMYGYRADEAVGRNISMLIPEGHNNDLAGMFKEISDGKKVHLYETVRCAKDGRRLYVSLTLSPIRNEAGAVIGVSSIERDVTEQRQARLEIEQKTQQLEAALKKLRKNEEILNETGEMAKVGGWEIDLESNQVFWTRTVKNIHEVPEDYEPTLGEAIHFFAPEVQAPLTEAIRRAREEGIPFDMEFPFVTAKGRRLWTRALGKPEFQDGKCIRLHGTFQDISELKHAVEEQMEMRVQFEQAQKLESIGQLAGGVAHDFNNMLNVIIGYGELALENLSKMDLLHGYVEEILGAGRRSAALTRQLLAFSRKQTLQPEVLDLNHIISNLEKMLKRLIGEDIELTALLAEDLDRVEVDPGQIEQVIMNLAVNARDAMVRGGKLTIETRTVSLDEDYAKKHVGVVPGKHVLLAMTDTGAGMDETTRKRIFEPFFTTKEKDKGTGLGLSTVYGIVKQSKGSIWVYSEPGQGTTFKVYLPCTTTGAATRKEMERGEETEGSGEMVLVVEDEPALRKLCSALLKKLNYRVKSAADGGEALLLVEGKKVRPDLVITDVVMPQMSGKVLVDRLRKTLPHIKVLYMSGYTDDTIVHHGILDAGTPFIQKPFNVHDLSKRIRELLPAKKEKSEVDVRQVS